VSLAVALLPEASTIEAYSLEAVAIYLLILSGLTIEQPLVLSGVLLSQLLASLAFAFAGSSGFFFEYEPVNYS